MTFFGYNVVNPLDTDVDRDVEIGTLIPSTDNGLEKIYAGPIYGDVSQERYNELLEDGSLGHGQQATQLIGGHLFKHASSIYKNVGEYIPDIELNQETKGALSTVKDVSGHLYNWTLRDPLEKTMTILGLPVEIAHKASKLQYEDGRLNFGGRGIGRAPLGIAEALITLGAGAVKSGAKGALTYADDLYRASKLTSLDNLAYATVGNTNILSQGANAGIKLSKSNIPFTTKNVYFALSQSDRQTQKVKDIMTGAEDYVRKGLSPKPGQPLLGLKNKTTVGSDGLTYKLTTERNKAGKISYRWRSVEGKKIKELTRYEARKLDLDTLTARFKEIDSKNYEKLVKSYKTTNKTVYKNLEDALRRYNLQNGTNLQVEHIIDVQHYSRLGDKTSRFSAKGADELFNIQAITASANRRSGAAAKFVDSGDALVENIDKFTDYFKVTKDFTKFKMDKIVKGMNETDWDRFAKLVIDNPDSNAHNILIKYFKPK